MKRTGLHCEPNGSWHLIRRIAASIWRACREFPGKTGAEKFVATRRAGKLPEFHPYVVPLGDDVILISDHAGRERRTYSREQLEALAPPETA